MWSDLAGVFYILSKGFLDRNDFHFGFISLNRKLYHRLLLYWLLMVLSSTVSTVWFVPEMYKAQYQRNFTMIVKKPNFFFGFFASGRKQMPRFSNFSFLDCDAGCRSALCMILIYNLEWMIVVLWWYCFLLQAVPAFNSCSRAPNF